jgi:chemotaxis protein CheX
MEATLPTQSDGLNLILPFLNSTRTVLSTMAGIAVTIGRPFLKANNELKHDVSGIIGFMGGLEGSVIISLEFSVARHIVKAFAGSEIPPDSPDFTDAIGELSNMIAGSAKQHLGVNASITVPTVIVGSNHQAGRLRGVPCVVIPCATPNGDFVVEVNIRRAEVPH